MADQEATLEDELEALRGTFESGLPQRLEAIEGAWTDVEAGAWTGDAMLPLYRIVHSLAGAGATFGFADLGGRAQALCDELRLYLDGERAKSADGRKRIAHLIAALGETT